jgi:hypothetical protein
VVRLAVQRHHGARAECGEFGEPLGSDPIQRTPAGVWLDIDDKGDLEELSVVRIREPCPLLKGDLVHRRTT